MFWSAGQRRVGSGVAVLQAQGGSDSSGVAVEFICNSIAVDEFICLITLNDKPIGPAALWHMDRQTVSSILLLLCPYICSTYYVRYVEYKYRSARNSENV